jgi:hypothetical protein
MIEFPSLKSGGVTLVFVLAALERETSTALDPRICPQSLFFFFFFFFSQHGFLLLVLLFG